MSALDEVFRNKLADHSISPPAQGWARLESTLAKKNSTAWYRWAAVLLLGAVLMGLWIRKTDQHEEQVAVQTLPQPVTTTPSNNTATTETKNQKKVVAQQSKVATAPVLQAVAIETTEMELVAVTLEEEDETVAVQQEATQSVPMEKGIVLEYQLGPVNAPSEVATAAVNDQGSSFMKVLDFAKGVKNGESTIGDLKEVKLELFAADHKKKSNAKNNE